MAYVGEEARMLRRLELGGRHPRLGRCGGGGGAVAAGLQEELDLVARRGARTAFVMA